MGLRKTASRNSWAVTCWEPPKSPGSSCWHCGAPPVTLLHDGCPNCIEDWIGSAAESQAFGNQLDDLAARAGAGNHVANVNGSWRPLPESASRRSSRCDGPNPEHTSCSRPEPACSTAPSEQGSNPGIPGSSTRQTQIKQWNEQLLDPGDFCGSHKAGFVRHEPGGPARIVKWWIAATAAGISKNTVLDAARYSQGNGLQDCQAVSLNPNVPGVFLPGVVQRTNNAMRPKPTLVLT